MSPILAHLAIYAALFLPIGNSKLLLVELGYDAKGGESNSSTDIGIGSPMAVTGSKTTQGPPM